MPAAKSDTTKTTRVTNVQVPGEAAQTSASSEEAKAEVSTATTLAAADNPAAGTDVGQGAGEAQAAGPSAEEVAALRAENEELRAQIAAAGRAKGTNAGAGELPKTPSRHNYLNMNASDVDPSTLTKSVLTKDGWVCPPQIAQTQPK